MLTQTWQQENVTYKPHLNTMWFFLMLEQWFIQRILTTSHLPILHPVWKPAFQFNLHTAFQFSPPSIPDILSASPPPLSLKRFCDTHISSRYIINSGEIHFAGQMIQWAKIIRLITGGYYSLFFLS